MRLRFLVVAVGAMVASSACGGSEVPRPARSSSSNVSGQVALLRVERSAVAVDAAGAALTLAARDAVASADGSVVATVDHSAGRTILRVLESRTGSALRSRTLAGVLWPRAVSADGGRVVLLAHPPAAAADDYRPAGRAETEVVIVPSSGLERRFRVGANIEPEAFALDNESMFVVEFTPATAPDRYRVRELGLDGGGLRDVFSVDKELQDEMRGTARTQAWSSDGRRLYTLYTLEADGEVNSFVHVLDLDEKWAHCVDLPAGLGTGPSGSVALAVSVDNSRLDVLDAASGRVAVVDTGDLSITSVGDVPEIAGSRIVAAATEGGVVASVGGALVELRDNEPALIRSTAGETAAAIAAVGTRLVIVGPAWAAVLGRDGSVLARLSLPWNIADGTSTAGALVDGRRALECAC